MSVGEQRADFKVECSVFSMTGQVDRSDRSPFFLSLKSVINSKSIICGLGDS